MFDINNYLSRLIEACRTAFGERLKYVGLQGSYMRGEATAQSDIDVMLILDRFSAADMDVYKGILKTLGCYERSCGFICGVQELKLWNPMEICHLRHTTKDLFGTLGDYLPHQTREDAVNYVKLSLGDLYHRLCHHYIHAQEGFSAAWVRSAAKSAFFLIQDLYFLESGSFLVTEKALREAVPEGDRQVLDLRKITEDQEAVLAFQELFQWCKRAFPRVEATRCTAYNVIEK